MAARGDGQPCGSLKEGPAAGTFVSATGPLLLCAKQGIMGTGMRRDACESETGEINLMIMIIDIAAFCLLILCLCVRFEEKLADVLPVGVCLLMFALYGLAFWNRLSWIDGISAAFLLFWLGWFLLAGSGKRRAFVSAASGALRHISAPAAAAAVVGAAFLMSGRVAVWWDDLNFWATDVKALYGLDGFAARYANAAPEFGDYPPGLQLLKWWFAHWNREQFSEGLMFAGYGFGVFAFLTPVLGRLKGRNSVLAAAAVLCLWAFPSVAEVFYCQGMCADLAMATVYGAFLAAVFDETGHRKSFYWLRLALYLGALVLIKSVGFLWAAFGLAFLWIRFWGRARRGGKMELRPLFAVTAAPLLSGGSWMLFCLLMRRVAKLTGAAVSMAAGNLPVLLPETRQTLLSSFAEAFAFWPLHRGSTWGVDFSPLGLFAAICLILFILSKKKAVSGADARLLGVFLPVSGLVFYGINLVSHLTIFAAETQYLEPFGMVSSIERYGAPFTVGSLYLLASLHLSREQKAARGYGPWLICLAFVAVSAHWPQVWQGFWGYRQTREEDLAAREEMISDESRAFLETVGELDFGDGMRVLYCRDAAENQWVKNTYVAFEASPVSLMFAALDPETMGAAQVLDAAESSHAGYLYCDPLQGDAGQLFSEFSEEFETGTLYRILWEGGGMKLEEANGD